MKFTSEPIGTGYLLDTPVENIFINEYMPAAPEGYVKVYLLARMYMNTGEEMEPADLARTLTLSEEDVEKALLYWVKQGLIRRDPEGIHFVSLKEQLYGRHRSKKRASSRGKELLDNHHLKHLMDELQRLLGGLPSGSDVNEVATWVDELKATDAVILGAARYCAKRGKKRLRYIGSVIRDWTGRGMATEEDVEKHLADADQQYYVFRRVMQALGFNRNATEEERRIISGWVDELGCSMDEILEACRKTSGISNPNINYINAILCSRHGVSQDSGQASNATVQQYYAFLRKKAEDRARRHRREVEQKIPAIAELDRQMIDCSRDLTQIMVAGGTDKLKRMAQKRDLLKQLEQEKTVKLTEYGIPADYMDVHYRCPRCGDTGVLDSGARCECWIRRSEEALEWKKKNTAGKNGEAVMPSRSAASGKISGRS